ncbi:tetratricopeptide repeat protein [Streptomyces sp. NPDC126522]|uniref:tetratricopeptide repeat protein n=1 Tax=Streptomyces sp. NPDC126522 TaxID=3155211 RepID=UPI0033285EC2
MDADTERLQRIWRHAALGNSLLAQARADDDPRVIEAAVLANRKALSLTVVGDDDRPAVVCNLCTCLLEQHRATGAPDDLVEATAILEASIAGTDPALRHYGSLMATYSAVLRARFDVDADHGLLALAIEAMQSAVDATPQESRLYYQRLNTLAILQDISAMWTADVQLLDRAAQSLRKATSASGGASGTATALLLTTLGSVLIDRYRLTDEEEALEESIGCLERVLSLGSVDDVLDAAGTSLGAALTYRYVRRGDPAFLSRALTVQNAILAATPEDHPERTLRLMGPANALRERSLHSGSRPDLDQAVDLLEEALNRALTPAMRAAVASSLGVALLDRYHLDGDERSLDGAVDAISVAVALTAEQHPERAKRLSNLGTALNTRYALRGLSTDFDRALVLLEDAVAADIGERRPIGLSNLASALLNRYRRTGADADFEYVVRASREALDMVPEEHPDRASYLSGVGVALHERFRKTCDVSVLDEAVDVFGQAARILPPQHADFAKRHRSLGHAAAARYYRTGVAAFRDIALASWQAAAGAEAGPATVRCISAQGWGRLAASYGDWAGARSGMREAVMLLPRLAHRRLDRGGQERHLARFSGLAGDAAACALHASDTLAAVDVLEHGRSVLWGQMLENRGDLAALGRVLPAAAARLRELQSALDPIDRVGDDLVVSDAETGKR